MIPAAKHAINNSLRRIGYEIKRCAPPHSAFPIGQTFGRMHDLLGPVYGPTIEREFLVTQMLFDRVTPDAMAAFDRHVANDPATYGYLRHAPPEHKRREVLRIGNYFLPEIFNPLTGLARFNPPQDIHAMVREEIYCGDLYYCDLIAQMLHQCGLALVPGGHYLDFGCSSGRILWTLKAAYPDSHFHGCDPNRDAVQWAQGMSPSVDFFTSPETPPLHLQSGHLDGAYAISIWSHFSESAALRWLNEMARAIKPGGFLLITTHGFGSLDHYETHGLMSPAQTAHAMASLNTNGHFFMNVFGPNGDWGVGKSDWGQSFINPTYLAQKLAPDWSLLHFLPRRSEDNQDVYLLQRQPN